MQGMFTSSCLFPGRVTRSNVHQNPFEIACEVFQTDLFFKPNVSHSTRAAILHHRGQCSVQWSFFHDSLSGEREALFGNLQRDGIIFS